MGAKKIIADEIMQLKDLLDEKWSGLSVTVTGKSGAADKICLTGAQNTLTINLYSDYGNIPGLGMLDSSYYSTDSAAYRVAANLTFSSNHGNGTLYECSNNGVRQFLTYRFFRFFLSCVCPLTYYVTYILVHIGPYISTGVQSRLWDVRMFSKDSKREFPVSSAE